MFKNKSIDGVQTALNQMYNREKVNAQVENFSTPMSFCSML